MPEKLLNDVKFEAPDKKSPADKKMEEQGIPVYLEKLELTDTQQDRAIKECIAEIAVIKEERKAKNLEPKWETLDNQYEGEVTEEELRQFNLNRNVTKVKVDAIVLGLKEAFFDADPVFAITPRPEFGRSIGVEVCNQQQDFLDYKIDNLPFDSEFDLVAHGATVKGLSWLELFYDIKRENRRREESYEFKLVPVIDPITKQVQVGSDGKPAVENKGLKDFLSNWPNAPKDCPGLVKKLANGEDITFVVSYKETIYNDPRPKFHDIKDVYVRLKTDGYEGLKTTKLIAVKESYTYWELKREENDNKFYNIDKLVDDKNKPGEKVNNFETLEFDIWKCTYYFKINEKDTEEQKVILWFNEDKKVMIGSIDYPLYAVPCCYIPFCIKKKNKGIYQPGVAEDLTDSNLAENALLNLVLEGAYIQNTVTPITKDPEIHAQFLEKRFTHGIPINGDGKNIDFLQKYMQPINYGGLIQLIQYLVQGDEQVSRVSSLMSGQDSPTDPSAPARKTLELMRASGKGMLDYVKIFSRSFNEVGYILLAIYFQMSKSGRAYTIRPENVVGDNPFGSIDRNALTARTNIQARAYMFEQDAVNAKVLDLTLYQTVRQEPLVAKNPEAVYTLLKNLVEGWSKKHKNIANKIIPSMEDFKKMQVQTAIQAVGMYIQGVMQNAQQTGVKPEFDIQQLIQLISDAEALLVNPPAPEVQKEMAKQNA